MAKYLDDNGLLYLWGQLKTMFGNKVDKVTGKDLSTNDYTTDEKNKLAGIATGAEVNVNADWNAVSGDAQILNKPSIPSKTSDLTNDSGYITSSSLSTYAPLASPTFTGTPAAPTASAGTNTTQIATTAFVGTAITNALAGITGISFEVVQELPSTGDPGTIYLLSNGGTGTNVYDEYIYVNNAWEKIGTTAVDLSNYWSKSELVAITNTEIDTILAS